MPSHPVLPQLALQTSTCPVVGVQLVRLPNEPVTTVVLSTLDAVQSADASLRYEVQAEVTLLSSLSVNGLWHERHIMSHLEHLTKPRDQVGDANARLEAVIEAYAFISHHRAQPGAKVGSLLNRGEQVARAQPQLLGLFCEVLSEAAKAGAIRDDVAPDELASLCRHGLTAAGSLPSEARSVGRCTRWPHTLKLPPTKRLLQDPWYVLPRRHDHHTVAKQLSST